MDKLVLSQLSHTWVLDLDGTIVKHNGYKIDGKDQLLTGIKDFLCSIPKDDTIIFLTARTDEYRQCTEDFLNENGIKYDHIIFNIPVGERILINDKKPSGLATAIAINTTRDECCNVKIAIDENL